MRQYLLDELSFLEHDNVEHYLRRSLKRGPIEGVYWLELPQELLAPPQLAHPDCSPFYFSVILEPSELRAEFLVRSSHNMRCSCIAWATAAQRQFVLDYIDKLLQEEFIAV
ncbi:PilZ domain-containing protein [Candidatus Electronema halotolerans]